MVSSKLRILMAYKKLNINDVVKLTGLSQPTISKLFNSNPSEVKTVKLETIDRVCRALNCTINKLLEIKWPPLTVYLIKDTMNLHCEKIIINYCYDHALLAKQSFLNASLLTLEFVRFCNAKFWLLTKKSKKYKTKVWKRTFSNLS